MPVLAAFRDFRELDFIGPSLAHLVAFATRSFVRHALVGPTPQIWQIWLWQAQHGAQSLQQHIQTTFLNQCQWRQVSVPDVLWACLLFVGMLLCVRVQRDLHVCLRLQLLPAKSVKQKNCTTGAFAGLSTSCRRMALRASIPTAFEAKRRRLGSVAKCLEVRSLTPIVIHHPASLMLDRLARPGFHRAFPINNLEPNRHMFLLRCDRRNRQILLLIFYSMLHAIPDVPMWLVSGFALLTGLNTKQSKVHGLHRIDLRQILGGVLRLRRGYGFRA